jgi:hypothetical protein
MDHELQSTSNEGLVSRNKPRVRSKLQQGHWESPRSVTYHLPFHSIQFPFLFSKTALKRSDQSSAGLYRRRMRKIWHLRIIWVRGTFPGAACTSFQTSRSVCSHVTLAFWGEMADTTAGNDGMERVAGLRCTQNGAIKWLHEYQGSEMERSKLSVLFCRDFSLSD